MYPTRRSALPLTLKRDVQGMLR